MRSITRSDLTGRSVVELRVLAAIFNRLLLAAPPLSADWHAAATTLDTAPSRGAADRGLTRRAGRPPPSLQAAAGLGFVRYLNTNMGGASPLRGFGKKYSIGYSIGIWIEEKSHCNQSFMAFFTRSSSPS